MSGKFKDASVEDRLLPGLARDYIGTQVLSKELTDLLDDVNVIVSAMEDSVRLPVTSARGGYYGENHLEYWLSGYRDAKKIMAAIGLFPDSAPSILDFGGMSGRVSRHLVRMMPKAEAYLTDANRANVEIVRAILGDKLSAFPAGREPSLPFPDAGLEIVVAFSTFTRLYYDDLAWLLEFRRVLKPGGILYATVHDEQTWERLPKNGLGALCFSNAEFKDYYDKTPTLQERVAHFYNDGDDVNCNVFHPKSYIHEAWGKFYDVLSINPAAHDHQAAVVLRRR